MLASTKKSSMRVYDVKHCVNRKSEPHTLQSLISPSTAPCLRKHYPERSFQNRLSTSSSGGTSDWNCVRPPIADLK